MAKKIDWKLEPRWYILNVIGGKEKAIIKELKERVKNHDYSDLVAEVVELEVNKKNEKKFYSFDELPVKIQNLFNDHTEAANKQLQEAGYVKNKDGSYSRFSKVVGNKTPGYIYIKMVYDQNLWYIIRNTSGVLGFLGSSGKGAKPNPISDSEFNKTAAGTIGYENLTKDGEVEGKESKVVEEEQSSQVYDTDLQVGQTVRVINGMWKGESGVIKLLDSAKGLAKVEIHLFGRVQTVDAKYDDLILDV